MASLDICSRWIGNVKGRWRNLATASRNAPKRKAFRIFPLAETGHSSRAKYYKQVQKDAREKFIQEVAFQSKDTDISLAKALLHIATEDEAFMAFNREMDAYSIQNEMKSTSLPPESLESTCMEVMPFPLAGKNVNEWMVEFDVIAKGVEAELVSREIQRNLVEVLDAVNTVLFKSRGFKRSSVLMDSKSCSYLHSVLSSGYYNAILLNVIYIEVCTRLHVSIVGSRIGEDFLIWPQSRSPERLHWKCASRSNHGLMLTSPLRSSGSFSKNDSSNVHLLRPQDLRLAIMASERLLILQPHNWFLRRDHGMMLYYSREYEEAVKELSIYMAFAPEEESEILEPFVEKLHLLCVESSWNKSFGHKGHLSVP